MKGVHQIYLFAATVVLALFFFIQRSDQSQGSLFEVTNNGEITWTVNDFGEVLFGRDSLPWKEMQDIYWPFLENQPNRFFWANERKNQVLIDHYTNVQNLCDQEKITRDLEQISANANELLGIPAPNQLFFYISGIDLDHPCLYFQGGKDSVVAFIGLDNFLGSAYPGYNAVPSYQRALLNQSQLVVRYANALLENQVVQNFNDPTLLGEMIYHGKRHVATEALIQESPIHEILGYSKAEYDFLESNERQIWEVLVRENLLFSTDIMVRQRLSQPAPFSKMGTAMDMEIPGRVAQFIGYRMIRSYAENHSDLTLKQLLTLRDAQRILRDAQYKP